MYGNRGKNKELVAKVGEGSPEPTGWLPPGWMGVAWEGWRPNFWPGNAVLKNNYTIMLLKFTSIAVNLLAYCVRGCRSALLTVDISEKWRFFLQETSSVTCMVSSMFLFLVSWAWGKGFVGWDISITKRGNRVAPGKGGCTLGYHIPQTEPPPGERPFCLMESRLVLECWCQPDSSEEPGKVQIPGPGPRSLVQ